MSSKLVKCCGKYCDYEGPAEEFILQTDCRCFRPICDPCAMEEGARGCKEPRCTHVVCPKCDYCREHDADEASPNPYDFSPCAYCGSEDVIASILVRCCGGVRHICGGCKHPSSKKCLKCGMGPLCRICYLCDYCIEETRPRPPKKFKSGWTKKSEKPAKSEKSADQGKNKRRSEKSADQGKSKRRSVKSAD